MKVVINSDYGGFGLSPKGILRYCELKGRECHFFTYEHALGGLDYKPCSVDEATKKSSNWVAFDITDASINSHSSKHLHQASQEQRIAWNKEYEQHQCFDQHSRKSRADPDLIKVIEELGEEANGRYAKLKIVEIPDDIEWEITDYDGAESVEEKHRRWG